MIALVSTLLSLLHKFLHKDLTFIDLLFLDYILRHLYSNTRQSTERDADNPKLQRLTLTMKSYERSFCYRLSYSDHICTNDSRKSVDGIKIQLTICCFSQRIEFFIIRYTCDEAKKNSKLLSFGKRKYLHFSFYLNLLIYLILFNAALYFFILENYTHRSTEL